MKSDYIVTDKTFFNRKMAIFVLSLSQKNLLWCSLAASQWDAANEYPQQIIFMTNMEISDLKTTPFIYYPYEWKERIWA